MARRSRRLWILAASALVLLPAGPASTPQGARRGSPARASVLIVTVDALRADRLSVYGYGRPTSPHLDRLLRAGVIFEQARTVEPLTSPSLCSMLTSVYPHQHGSSRNGLRMRSGLVSLPKVLRAAGYRTAAFVGNWTLREKLSGLDEHFEDYEAVLNRKRWFGLVSSESSADDLTAASTDWLRDHVDRHGDAPFLLWVHYVEPHAPYRLHEEMRERLGIPAGGKVRPHDRYDTEIAYVDESIGTLLGELERLGLSGNTIVAFASDHGESLGEHNYWGHGRQLYEPALRIPMSLTWPGHLAPGRVRAPALNLDLPPTVLSLVGLERPQGFMGYDWSLVFAGGAPPLHRVTHHQAHRGAVLSRHDSELARRAGLLEVGLVEGMHKEIYRLEKNRHFRFDLRADPGESSATGAAAADPQGQLMSWMREVYEGLNRLDSEPPEPLDGEDVEQLRSLGYTD